MPKPVEEQPIQVSVGPNYKRDLEQYPHVDADVDKVLDEIVKPAVIADPIQPHKHGAGTPINQGILSIRVPNSAGGQGKRGGFRLVYHWDRQKRCLTKLQITIRKDAESLTRKAVAKLLAETGSSKTSQK